MNIKRFQCESLNLSIIDIDINIKQLQTLIAVDCIYFPAAICTEYWFSGIDCTLYTSEDFQGVLKQFHMMASTTYQYSFSVLMYIIFNSTSVYIKVFCCVHLSSAAQHIIILYHVPYLITFNKPQVWEDTNKLVQAPPF